MTRKPNPQLKQIVLEETNDGRDVVRFLKSTFMDIEDAPLIFGLRHKDYARSHKIAAARILARIGLEEGKRYLGRTYVPTPFKRVHPEDEDLPRKEMAASTSELYRLVKKETSDGRDIIIRFVGIMKGHYPEYKPHLRMAAAKELIRQIEFDYDEEPTGSEPASASTDEPTRSEPTSDPIDNSKLKIDNSDNEPTRTEPVSKPTSDPIDNSKLTIDNSDANPIDNSKLTIEPLPPRPHHEYAREHCAEEEESIYTSIIRRAAERPDIDSAKIEAERLIAEFNRFAQERNPNHRVVAVPDDMLSKSLTQRMQAPETYEFDPADYYDLDRDDFYFCLCRDCDECEEIEFFEELMRDLEEEYEDP